MAEQPAAARAYLDVPFSEKDTAKADGARWDPKVKRWYDPHGATPALARWATRPPIPELLPGEDRTFGEGLFVDLVPRSCWFTNVRSCVSEQDWQRLRRPMLRRAGYRCEICGAGQDRDARQWLDLHERWDYDEPAAVQRLRRLIAVCQPCHEVTHFGLANVRGRTEEAFAHLCSVTGMDRDAAGAHVDAAQQVWLARSRRTWELDLSMLTGVGLAIQRPPSRGERVGHAERALREVRTDPPAAAVPVVASPRAPTDAPATRPVSTRGRPTSR